MNLMKISLGLNIVATIFAFVVMALTFIIWCLFTWFDSEDNKYRYSHFVMTFSILLICLIQATLGILASIFASYAIGLTLGSPIVGKIIDKAGHRNIMIYGTTLMAIACSSFGLA